MLWVAHTGLQHTHVPPWLRLSISHPAGPRSACAMPTPTELVSVCQVGHIHQHIGARHLCRDTSAKL